MLHAEAIPSLFLQAPILKGGQVFPSIRYEPLAQEFQGAPLSHLLWDLAHSLSSVRLCSAESVELVRLDTYWPEKTAQDWVSEALVVNFLESARIEEASVDDQREVGIFSKASVPEASLLQVLRVAGAILNGASDFESLFMFFADEDRPSKPVSRMALEVLLRAGMFPIRTVGEPGLHGATVLGMQGIGVSTPKAAEVAAATVGLAIDVHMPKVMMFTSGL